MRRTWVLAIAAVAALFAAWSVMAGAVAPEARAASARWVRVSVATVWVEPGQARKLDAPAVAYPADPRAWIASMSVAQKRWLVGRLETQVLYGTKVRLLKTSGAWAKIVIPSQPTPRDKRGYPGWVPRKQLTARAPQAAPRQAVVRRPTAWLYETAELKTRVLELSYGTRLPAVAWSDNAVEVVAPDGRHHFIERGVVAMRVSGATWPVVTGKRIATEAKRFLGLQYLWAGTSGFGFDCSGFTYSVYRAVGITIPRDGAPQFAAGRKVASRSALRPGDLVFFRASGSIHHVGLYIGSGKMIHAPRTGSPVAIVSLGSEPYRSEFAGGRRYVP